MTSLPDLDIWKFALCALVTLFAGFTKGVTGFALPMIMVSGMAMFIDPKLAIATIVVPAMVGNLWQAMQQGWREALTTLKKYKLLIGTTLVMIFVHAQWINYLNFNTLLMLLGFAIAGISLVQILGVNFKIKPENKTIGAFITGQIAGFFGAIAGTWGPPTIIYLLAVDTPKQEQVRVAGIAFGLGAVMFWIAHGKSGLVTGEALGLSIALLVPMAIGLYAGNQAQGKIDQKIFRQITLWVLLIAGLNILRKAMMG